MSVLPVVAAYAVAVLAAVRGMWSPCGLSMLSALNPVSETARGHRYPLTAAWYVAGATAGGALLGGGAALLALSWSLTGARTDITLAVLLAGAAVAVASDSPLVPFALPDHPRQVDERWIGRYRRWVYAAGFGLQIGTGVATYVMTAAVWTALLFAGLTGDPATAFTVGVTFGLVRGLGVLVTSRVCDAGQLRRLVGRVDRLGPAALRIAAVANAAAGAAAAYLLAGPPAGVLGAAVLVPLAAPVGARRLRTRRAGRSPRRSRPARSPSA